jgi:hypothetical protein
MWWARLLNNTVALHAGGVPPELGAWESIFTVTVGAGGQSSVSFTSIPTDYKHLQVRVSGLTAGWLTMRCNSDSTSGHYYGHELRGDGSSASSQSLIGYDTSFMWIALPASSSYPLASVIDVLDYQASAKHKTVRALSGNDANGSGYIQLTSNCWASFSSVSSIQMQIYGGGNFSQYSSFALYGIKG